MTAACWEEVLLQNANYEMAYVGTPGFSTAEKI